MSAELLSLDRLGVLLLLLLRCVEVVHHDRLAELRVDVLERPLARLREEEVDDGYVDCRRTNEHEEELVADVVQGDGASHEYNDLCGELVEHADRGALAPDFSREDLAHVEVLGRVEAGAPEEDEKVDEENGGALARFVGAARVDGLQGTFADEGDENAARSDEHELAPAEFVDE